MHNFDQYQSSLSADLQARFIQLLLGDQSPLDEADKRLLMSRDWNFSLRCETHELFFLLYYPVADVNRNKTLFARFLERIHELSDVRSATIIEHRQVWLCSRVGESEWTFEPRLEGRKEAKEWL